MQCPGSVTVHRAFQPLAGGRTLCQCLASSQVAAERASELILEPACATGPWFLQGPSVGPPFKNQNQDPTAAIGQDSGRVLTRTLGEYFSGGHPRTHLSLIIMDLY